MRHRRVGTPAHSQRHKRLQSAAIARLCFDSPGQLTSLGSTTTAFQSRGTLAHCATPLQVTGSTKTGVQAPVTVMPMKLRLVWQKLGTQTAPGFSGQYASWQGSARHRTPGSANAHVTWFGITATTRRHSCEHRARWKLEGLAAKVEMAGGSEQGTAETRHTTLALDGTDEAEQHHGCCCKARVITRDHVSLRDRPSAET